MSMLLFDFDDDVGPLHSDPGGEALRQAQRAQARGEAERRVANTVFAARPEGMLIALVTVLVPLAAAGSIVLRTRDFDTSVPIFFGAAAAGLALYFASLKLLAPWVLAREQQWLRSLPFRVHGYFDALAPEAPRDGRLKVLLEFRDAPPPADKLEAWLAAVGAKKMGRASMEFLSPRISVRTGNRGTSRTMRGFYTWERRLLKQVLLTVNAVHALQRVVIRRGE